MWYNKLTAVLLIFIFLYPIHVLNFYKFQTYSIKAESNFQNTKVNSNEPVIFNERSFPKNNLQILGKEFSSLWKKLPTPTAPKIKQLKVKKSQTIIDEQTLKNILIKTHLEVFNKPASSNRIHMAWAQIAFENGRGIKVYNYNLGNIGGEPVKPTKPYYKVAGSRFRSFNSFEEGARYYWSHLKERCSSSLHYFDNGDPYTAGLSLGRCGYYRSAIDFYQKNLASLYYESYKKSLKE